MSTTMRDLSLTQSHRKPFCIFHGRPSRFTPWSR
jgi:hypothetical protein